MYTYMTLNSITLLLITFILGKKPKNLTRKIFEHFIKIAFLQFPTLSNVYKPRELYYI